MSDPKEAPGGLDRYRTSVEERLRAYGHRVLAVHRGSGTPSAEEWPVSGSTPFQQFARVRSAVRGLLADIPVDVVASHFAMNGLPAMLTKAKSIPWVVHFHGPWAAESRVEGDTWPSTAMKGAVERTVYRHAARVLVLSRAFGEIAIRSYGVSSARVHVVPAGVDVERFRPGNRTGARKAIGIPQDRFVVLTVRRLRRRMGLSTLIDAADSIRHKDMLWLIAGGGPLQDELQRKVHELGLGDKVRLLGRVPDSLLPTVYQAADLFVLPTVALEGFGLVILEALATGVPVIGTRVGGIPEVLESYSVDSLLPSGATARDVAQRVSEVAEGHLKLPDRDDARHYVLDRHTWEIAAQSVERHYLQVTSQYA